MFQLQYRIFLHHFYTLSSNDETQEFRNLYCDHIRATSVKVLGL